MSERQAKDPTKKEEKMENLWQTTQNKQWWKTTLPWRGKPDRLLWQSSLVATLHVHPLSSVECIMGVETNCFCWLSLVWEILEKSFGGVEIERRLNLVTWVYETLQGVFVYGFTIVLEGAFCTK